MIIPRTFVKYAFNHAIHARQHRQNRQFGCQKKKSAEHMLNIKNETMGYSSTVYSVAQL